MVIELAITLEVAGTMPGLVKQLSKSFKYLPWSSNRISHKGYVMCNIELKNYLKDLLFSENCFIEIKKIFFRYKYISNVLNMIQDLNKVDMVK